MGALRILRKRIQRQFSERGTTETRGRAPAPAFEMLEQRLLLSADSMASVLARPLSVDLHDGLNDVTLRLAEIDGGSVVQIVDQAGNIQAQRPLDEVTEIAVNGADFVDDTLRIDLDSPLPVPVSFRGGDGDSDTLRGPLGDSDWNITELNAGVVEGIQFTGVENLTGASDNEDTFIFAQEGGISGLIDGGPGGFDSLLVNGTYDRITFVPTGPDSGTVDRDGNLITYAGLEPVNTGTATDVVFTGTAGVDNWVIEDSPTAGQIQVRSTSGSIETTSFANPTTLTLNLGTGNDTVTVNSFGDSGFAGTVNINGQGDTDKLIVSQNVDMTLTDGSIIIGSTPPTITLSSIEQAELTGGGSPNNLNASGFSGSVVLSGLGGGDTLTGGSGNDTLSGGSGDDKYVFSGSWGTDTISSPDPGTDIFDFTAVDLSTTPLMVTADKHEISDGTNKVDQSTTAADQAEEIDVILPFTGASLGQKVTKALADLSSLIDRAQTDSAAFTQLTNALPLLSALTGGALPDLGNLLDLSHTFQDLKAAVENALSTLPDNPKLSDIVTRLQAITLPSLFTGTGNSLTFSTDYRGAATDGTLEALIDLALSGSVEDSIPLNLGADAGTKGLNLNGSVDITATASGTVGLGLTTTGTLTPFLVPGGTLTLGVTGDAKLNNASLNLGVLSVNVTSGSEIKYVGSLGLELTDPESSDQRITSDELASLSYSIGDFFSVTDSSSFPIHTINVTIDPGVKVGGTFGGADLGGAGVSVTITPPSTIFGIGTDASQFGFSFSAVLGGNSISLDDFENVSVTDLLGMLGQVLDSLTGLGKSQVLLAPIPFTGKTVGDIVDLATGFKTSVLDPLFKSGDILHPDFNGDGATDFNDLYFSGIQSLAQAITAQLGLGSLLDVNYDATAKELTFALNYAQAVGHASVAETTQGKADPGGVDEVQTLTIPSDVVASGGLLADTFRLAFPDNNGHLAFTDPIALHAAGSVVETRLQGINSLTGNVSVGTLVQDKNGDHYDITFTGGQGKKNVPLLVVDAKQLALGIPLDFGTSLGDIASVKTTGTAIMAAGFTAGLTFGIDLDPSSTVEVAPPLFQPDNSASVTVETTTQGTANLNEFQKIHVNNATSGTYTLWFDANKDGVKQPTEETDPIAFDAPATGTDSVQDRLQNLSDITTVNVTFAPDGNDRIYTVEFQNPGDQDVAQLVGESLDVNGHRTLKGPAENGILSADATFDAQVFYNPAFAVVTTQQGVKTTTDELQTINILNATAGKFTLSFNGVATSKLTYGDTGAVVQAALELLPGIGTGNVTVNKVDDNTYTVDFNNSLGNVALLTGDVLKTDPEGLVNTTPFVTLTGIPVSKDPSNTSLADPLSPAADTLAGDVQKSVNDALIAAGKSLGFFTTDLFTHASPFLATHTPMSTLPNDQAFTLTLNPAQIQAATTTDGVTSTTSEEQTVTVSHAIGGTFTLTLDTATTSDIPFNATAAALKAALEALPAIGTGNVSVEVASAADPTSYASGTTSYTLTFNNSLGNLSQLVADGSNLTSKTVKGSVRKFDADAHGLTTAMQNAINGALSLAGLTDTVAVALPGGYVQITPTGTDLVTGVNLQFRSPITADGGGGKISLSVSPLTTQISAQGAPVNIDGRVQIAAGFTNTAYQEMGLLTEPTHFDGTTSNAIDLTLVVNGTGHAVHLAKKTTTDGIDGLIAALQAAVDSALGGSNIVMVERDDPDPAHPAGNRIKFVGGGTVTSLAVNVSDSSTNGAITDLGFLAGNGEVHRAKADAFFLDNVGVHGNFDLAATNVTATASLGFLGITATGSGTLGDNKFVHVQADLDLRDPVDGGTRVSVQEIANSLKNGNFFYVDAQKGGTDDSPNTGVVEATLAGGVGVHLDAEPSTPLGGISELNAFLDLTATSPNWLTEQPSFADPLGFGTDEHALSSSPITLGTALPTNGHLTDSVTFVISDGTNNALVFLPSSATSTFSSPSDVQSALQTAVPSAMSAAGVSGTVTVGLDTGKITLTGTGTTLKARGPIAFSGPDLQSIIDKFRDLNFDDIIGALKLIVTFLQSLGDGGVAQALDFKIPLIDKSVSDLVDIAGTFADKLNTIVNNPAGAIQELNDFVTAQLGFTAAVQTTTPGGGGFNEVQQITIHNPIGEFSLSFGGKTTGLLGRNASAAEVQTALNGLSTISTGGGSVSVTGAAGGPYTVTFDGGPLANTDVDQLVGHADIFSFDATNQVLGVEFDLGASAGLARPFNLDLADAGLPDFFTNLVSLSASGSLNVSAGIDFDLKMGLDLSGSDKALFLVTGADGTKLDATLDASGHNLNFSAALGPFALSVIGGSAGLDGTINISLVDDGSGRLNLLDFSGGTPTFKTPTLSDLNIDFPTDGGKNSASVNLPLFLGTQDSPIPLDFGGSNPGHNNALMVDVDLVKLLGGQTGAFDFTLPDFDFSHFQVPGLFALLSDPSVTVDGLDRLLGTIQDALNGQVMGVRLPLLGDALANNPVSNFIGDFRDDVLQPLARVIRENNLNLDGLITVIQQTLFDVFSTKLGILQDGPDAGTDVNITDIAFTFLDDSGAVAPELTATAVQLEMDLGKTFTFQTDPIDLDVGIPALGIEAQLQPEVTISFDLHLGFGVDTTKGFYFVSRKTIAVLTKQQGDSTHNEQQTVTVSATGGTFTLSFMNSTTGDLAFNADASTVELALEGLASIGSGNVNVTKSSNTYTITFQGALADTDVKPLTADGSKLVTDALPELTATVYADLGSQTYTLTSDANNDFAAGARAHVDAQLLFLALKIADGVDLNGDGTISRGADANSDGIPDDITKDEFTHIYFSGGIGLADPNNDGKLTIAEMVSGSFSDIVKPTLTGDAALYAQGRVDFSTLGEGLGNILPAISADLLLDFGLSADTTHGFQVAPPQVMLANITLDLGSFLDSFAGPILTKINDILAPFDWLIGPDGFLNKRIPLLSDLAGHTITGKDLIVFFDPDDGPTVVAVLNVLQELQYFSGLVSQAAGETAGLNFGDLKLFGDPSFFAGLGAAFTDHMIDLSTGLPDIRNLSNLNNAISNLPDPETLASQLTTTAPPSQATSSFTSGVSESTSVQFPILKPENIFKLIMGQPVSLVEIGLPKMQFNFLYRQAFPIIGPLVGTFAGGVGGGLQFGFGYDTLGISEFISTKDPADLFDGFFLNDLDPKTGQDVPEAFLTAQIAVGAALDLGIASAGVEGGISAAINFNFDDLNNDGKIRISELEALLEANSFNPLAVFDVSGEIDLFMRAYVEFLFVSASFEFARLTLFKFEVEPTKPPMLGSLDTKDGVTTLTLNIGPNAASRQNGDVSDGDENIVLTMDGSDVVVSSFTVNGVDQHPVDVKGFGRFSGVSKIVVDGGSGNDTIDLSGVSDSIAITAHGGVGDDTITTGAGDDTIFGDAGTDTLHGGGGNDTISGGDGDDHIYGDAGNDTLMGDAGTDDVHGGTDDDTLFGGAGNDSLFGDGGTNIYALADFGSIETIDATGGGDTLDFSTKPQGLTFFLLDENNAYVSGLQIQVGMTQTVTHNPAADPLDPTGPQVPPDPGIGDFTSQIYVSNVDGIQKIIGSDYADTFYIHQTTTSGQIELDGGKGSDRYVFITSPAHIDAIVNDVGNPWDSADVIEVRGTSGADTITVTDSQVDMGAGQTVEYVAPAADANVLQIKVFGKGGDDTLDVESTAVTVPVRVDGGGGNDLFTVGGDTVNNITGLARTGLNTPLGLGPLVLVGGAGQDSLIVDDSGDSTPGVGNSTAFLETRLGFTEPIEVGVVSGLGMTIHADVTVETTTEGDATHNEVQLVHVNNALSGTYTLSFGGNATAAIAYNASAAAVQAALQAVSGITSVDVSLAVSGSERVYTVEFTNPGDTDVDQLVPDISNLFAGSGRVEFEGFEALDVRMGKGDDAFTVGGDAIIADLPQNRQPNVIHAVVTTTTQGDGSHDEVQQVKILGGHFGTPGSFTLTYGSETTDPIPFDATAGDVQAALELLSAIGTGNVAVTMETSGIDDVYGITFQNGLGNQDVPQLVGLVANGNTITGMTIIEGAGGGDTINVIATNTLDRSTLLTSSPGPLVSNTITTPGVDGSTSQVENITVKGAGRGVGYFTIGYRFDETRPILFGATAQQVQDALTALPLISFDAANNPNVNVSKTTLLNGDDVYTITFQHGLANKNLPGLTPLITPMIITGDTAAIGTAAKTMTQGQPTPATNEVQEITIHGVTGLTTFTLTFQVDTDQQTTTPPLDYGASATDVQTALEALSAINPGDVTVTKSGDTYTVTFQGALAATDVALLLPRIVQDGVDTLNVQSIREDTFFLGGGNDDTVNLNVDVRSSSDPLPAITTNGVNAHVTLDGQTGNDTYDIHLIGGLTASLVNVFDTGAANDGFDRLTVTGTELPDLFLLRAAAAQTGLAFIALLNHDAGKASADQPYERVNYDINVEEITVNSLGGDDEFYIDDTRATITINAGEGNDFFQIAQLYQTERISGPSTNILESDAYATIETTKGWLSNGVSFPITINGEAGEDLFIVFHNLAVADLNGGADDDTFIVQAFALAGSTEDHRALTDLSGDAGADFIQYAVNAPVNINGGDGFDTVIVIGTEFGDDFVVTPRGVFGAGLNVNFINVELLQVDGAEGDDRFFILGTDPDIVTEIAGGLGTDLFSINGPTPANGVISNDLRGHSGILTHEVISTDAGYEGLKVVGISANVADNDEPAIIVTETDGSSMVVEGDTGGMSLQDALDAHFVDSYSIVLARPPVNGSQVVISIAPPPGLVFVDDSLDEKRDAHGKAVGITLTFTGSNWYQPQVVYFKVDTTVAEIPELGDMQHKVVATDMGNNTRPEISGFATGGGDNGSPVTVATTTPGDATHNEVQQVTVAHTSGFGYFALTFRDAETDPIAFGASAADVQTALLALPLIGKDALNQPNVAVTGGAGGPYTITFQNGLANQDVQQIKGRELSTLVDPALNGIGIAPTFTTQGSPQNLPEGLRGAFITIVDSLSHPEVVGQTRLILFNNFDPNNSNNMTLIVNKPWSLHGLSSLPTDAKYEIKMFSGMSIPNVRVNIFSQQTPALVVWQTGGSTSVAEISDSTVPSDILDELSHTQVDEIDVRLSAEPSGTVTVNLDGHGQLEFFDKDDLASGAITSLTFTDSPGSWDTFRHILVRGIDDLVKEGFHKSDVTLTASGGGYDNVTSSLVANIADNEIPGVRIVESNGSTDVIEYSDGDFGLSEATLSGYTDNGGFPPNMAGLPFKDTYQIVLTQAPTDDVTVTIISNPTRTSRTGGIRSFVEQLEISTDGGNTWSLNPTLTFDATHPWDVPQTVLVRALNDTRVDGGDTKVFAPTLAQLNSIQGPLMITGAQGPDHTGLTEREPIMLPYEKNEKPSMGDVVSATEASDDQPATITIRPSDIDQSEIDAINAQPNASVILSNAPLSSPSQLVNVSIQITHGPGKNKVRYFTGGVDNGDGTWTMTLNHEWFSPFPAPGNASVPDGTGKYVLMQTNPNLLVHEEDQTDILQVYDTDNVNDYNDPNFSNPDFPDGNPFAIGQLFYDDTNLFGAKATVSTQVNGGPKVDGPAVNEVQQLVLTATAGTFKLVFAIGNQTTDPLNFDATAAQIQSALEALSNIGAGNVEVTQPNPLEAKFLITFTGALSLTDQPKLHADATNLVGGLPLKWFRITGLGMGGTGDAFERTIGTGFDARQEPGGIAFQQFEDLEIDLGPGNDYFTIDNTQAGVKTVLNTGAGADLVDVKAISGHTFVNLGAGDDTINVHDDNNTLEPFQGLLTVSGDVPRAEVVTLAKGSPAGTLATAVNEIQQLTIDATGGTFTVSLTNPDSQVTTATGNLDWNISASALQDALQTLVEAVYGVNGGTADVQVAKAGGMYRITFVDELAGRDIPLLAANESGLVNGLGAMDVMNVDDSGHTEDTVGVLTSSSLTGLSTTQVNEIQDLVVDADQGTFTVSFNGQTSGPLAYNVSAADLQTALQTLPGTPIMPGDVAVTKNDDVYVIRFQGNLTSTDVAQLVATSVDLRKRVEDSGGDPNAVPSASTALAADPHLVDGSVNVYTRLDGKAAIPINYEADNPTGNAINDEQVVTVSATGGTYTLTLLSGTAQQFTTLPIAFDASAEVVRQTLQNAAAAAIAPGDTFEPQKFAVTVDKYTVDPNGGHDTVYIIGFQGRLRQFDSGPGVDLLQIDASNLTGGIATVSTRMDGINYYGIEIFNIDTGMSNDIFSIQGTTAGSRGFYLGANGILGGGDDGMAVTNVRFNAGDEQTFISSQADLDFDSKMGFDFLTGDLNDVNGALNLDFGTGRHKLMISDEGTAVGDSVAGDGTPVVITDTVDNVPGGAASRGLPALQAEAEIWITGLAGLPGVYPEGGISYGADSASGNFFDGIVYWTGWGNDAITIDGTVNRDGSGERTMTMLNTGLGNDNVTVSLDGVLNQPTGDTGEDGYFALNTMGGSFSPIPTTAAITDNDVVDASASTLPLVIFGGLGNDDIKGGTPTILTGQADDIVFGDDGRVQYADPDNLNTLLAVVGFGGRGDVISSQILFPTWAFSRDLTLGGVDTIRGSGGEDILVGGAAGDSIDGNGQDDLIFGDAVKISRRPADITNLRFETLSGTQIYGTPATNAAGADNADNTARNYRDPDGTFAPSWALWRIHNLYHTTDIQNGIAGSLGGNMDGSGRNMLTGGGSIANSFGGDYIAGGAASDEIFGQLGNDTIQGDGSIDFVSIGNYAAIGTRVGATRDGLNALLLNPSFEASTDGDDYIEGDGGNDVIFGNLGQDDIVGGSSDLFTLITAAMRPDGADMIFGGAGTHAGRYDYGDLSADSVDVLETQLHARDSDTIVGDNGDIFRLVGINGSDGGGFLAFNYDQNSTSEPFEDRGDLRIIPRATRLLDYTPGGPDFTLAVEPAPLDVAINPITLVRDIGAADEIHGEGGDDSIYGMVGNDVLFGDAQNDVLIGGYGADWISGGTGEDGILGDDGRIFVSRNSTSVGEPLYGIDPIPAASANQLVSTPDDVDNGIINVTPTVFLSGLKYTVDLTPQNLQPSQPTPPDPLFRPLYANDIIYGGGGNDSIHGGAGDDAISGAEALAGTTAANRAFTNNYNNTGTKTASHVESDFAHPYNPGNPLGYQTGGANATKFDLYDANDPLRTVMLTPTGTLAKTGGDNWILNFDQTEGITDTYWIQGTAYTGVKSDGDDHIFGDLGNDWIVGGTGRDSMYSGWGDDLINLDDDLMGAGTTKKGTFTPGTDTNPSYEDLAYGGAGIDIFLINTNGDRALDWVGEFNSFFTPFAQYGAVSVNRLLRPGEPEYLYVMSASGGADQTLAAQYGSDSARNGEPFGELGLVLQQDAAWQAQSGASRDPQPGNIGGGKVDLKNSVGTAGTLPIYETAGGVAPTTASIDMLVQEELTPIAAEAKLLWTQVLGVEDSRVALLDNVQVVVGNLPADKLGATLGDTILIDSNAAGYGWFVDPTPADSSEFAGGYGPSGIDLLTVVMHELGHVLGFADLTSGKDVADLMFETLTAGVRRVETRLAGGTARTPTVGLSRYVRPTEGHSQLFEDWFWNLL